MERSGVFLFFCLFYFYCRWQRITWCVTVISFISSSLLFQPRLKACWEWLTTLNWPQTDTHSHWKSQKSVFGLNKFISLLNHVYLSFNHQIHHKGNFTFYCWVSAVGSQWGITLLSVTPAAGQGVDVGRCYSSWAAGRSSWGIGVGHFVRSCLLLLWSDIFSWSETAVHYAVFHSLVFNHRQHNGSHLPEPSRLLWFYNSTCVLPTF